MSKQQRPYGAPSRLRARSRSGSDTPPACHSLPSRRFATPKVGFYICFALNAAGASPRPTGTAFLPVEPPPFSPSFLRRRKQSLHSVTAACDLAKRWRRLVVAREDAGIYKGQPVPYAPFLSRFAQRSIISFGVSQRNRQ